MIVVEKCTQFLKLNVFPVLESPLMYVSMRLLISQVKFIKGNAVVLDEDTGMSSDVTLLNCLHTKWPGLVVTWENNIDPSIN